MAKKTPEEQREEFLKCVRDGGTIVVHPDTWAELKRQGMVDMVCHPMFGNRLITSEFVKPGDFFAYAKNDMERYLETLHVRATAAWNRRAPESEIAAIEAAGKEP